MLIFKDFRIQESDANFASKKVMEYVKSNFIFRCFLKITKKFN